MGNGCCCCDFTGHASFGVGASPLTAASTHSRRRQDDGPKEGGAVFADDDARPVQLVHKLVQQKLTRGRAGECRDERRD